MEAAIIIGSVVLFISALIGLYLFDLQVREKFQYTFIFSKPKLFSLLISAVLFALSYYGSNNQWDTANVYVCASTGALIFLIHAYFNYKKTNFIYGTIGTLLQAIVTVVVGYFTILLVIFFIAVLVFASGLSGQANAIRYSR